MKIHWTKIAPCVGIAVGVLLGAQYAAKSPGLSSTAPAALTPDEEDAVKRLKRDVEEISRAGERRPHLPSNLRKAADHLAGELRRARYDVVERQFSTERGSFTDVSCEVTGNVSPKQVIVVGAHYDGPRNGAGADDNASGCAVLLELARMLEDAAPERTIRFVFFALMKPPFLGKDTMSSRQWLEAARANGDDVVAMLSLDTLGYYDVNPGAQSYPPPFGLFYPDRGDWVGFVANPASRDLLFEAVLAFRAAGRMPSEALTLPAWLPGMRRSDHASFWRADIPAVLVTDSGGWRNKMAGTRDDTSATLDYASMARTTTGLAAVVLRLAGRASL